MANNFLMNSWGRVFIQESDCSLFGYSDDCGVQVAGISESFGDVTSIYCSSDTTTGEYQVVAQVAGAETAPTTTITSYLPADGYSQLLRLARRRCSFNMFIKYGECSNPTDFNDFEYGIVFEGVRITSSSSTDLTSRSPDTRALIDLTFEVSLVKAYDIHKADFTAEVGGALLGGALRSIYVFDNSEYCGGSGCTAECQVMVHQYDPTGNTHRFIRQVNGVWYSTVIEAGLSASGRQQSWVYTDGETIYIGYRVVVAGQNRIHVWSLNYADIDNAGATISLVYDIRGVTHGSTYAYGGNLYFTISNGDPAGIENAIGVINLSNGSISTIGSGVFTTDLYSIAGSNDTLFIGTLDGELFKYKGGLFTNISDPSWNLNDEIQIMTVHGEDNINVTVDFRDSYCTTDGGNSWSAAGSTSADIYITGRDLDNPWHVVGTNYTAGNIIWESFDGGLSFIRNRTYEENSDVYPTGVSFCDGNVYVATASDDQLSSYGVFIG